MTAIGVFGLLVSAFLTGYKLGYDRGDARAWETADQLARGGRE